MWYATSSYIISIIIPTPVYNICISIYVCVYDVSVRLNVVYKGRQWRPCNQIGQQSGGQLQVFASQAA